VLGESININKLYKSAGVDPTTGLYQFYDNKGSITSSPNSETDRSIISNRLPKFFGGFQNSFSFKGFELDVLFQFVKQIAPGNYIGDGPGGIYSNQPVSVLERWKVPSDVAPIQRYATSSNITALLSRIYAGASDLSYSNASYIRLKNLSLTWQMPTSWLNKVHLQKSNIFVQGQNLLTFTKYKGLDPENTSIGNLPPLKILTVGFQIIL
jgi:hypothetical protein